MKKIYLNSKIKIYITFIFCVTLLFVLIAFAFNQLSPNRWQALYKIKINPEAIIYLRSTESVIIAINGIGSSPKLLELVEREMTNTAEMLNRKELRTNIKLTNDHLVVKLIDGENISPLRSLHLVVTSIITIFGIIKVYNTNRVFQISPEEDNYV